MYKLRPFLPLKVMKNVCYSLIYSHIVYAIEVWVSAFKSELKKIFVLQKRVMRLLTFNDVIPTDLIFAKLNVLKLMIFIIIKYQNLSLSVFIE